MNGFGKFLHGSPGTTGGMPVEHLDVVAIIMILLLLGIGGIAGFFVWLSRRHARQHQDQIDASLFHQQITAARQSAALSLLGLPARWLAIHSANHSLIQDALGLRNVQPCTWEEGFAQILDHRLFVTPPIDGWTLVLGTSLPDAADDVDAFYRYFLELSHRLGHVQYFTANRTLNHHGWARAEDGKIIRAYLWAGETLWNEGPQTIPERNLQVTCLDYAESPAHSPHAADNPLARNTERISQLAAEWSVNPAGIREPRIFNSPGIVGIPANFKIH